MSLSKVNVTLKCRAWGGGRGTGYKKVTGEGPIYLGAKNYCLENTPCRPTWEVKTPFCIGINVFR